MTGKKTKTPTPASTERARKAAIAEIQQRIDAPDAATQPPEATTPPETAAGVAVAGPDAGAATATKSKKGRKGAKAKDATAKATPPAKEPKAARPAKEKNPPKPKRVSLLDSAATVLAEAKEPMSAKEIVADVLNRKLWSTKGETPEATLYAAMIREIAAKKGEARFKKVDRGLFVAHGKGG